MSLFPLLMKSIYGKCYYYYGKSIYNALHYKEHLWEVLVTNLYQTLCDPMDCSPPGFSVHGILQARILEWVAIPFFRQSSQLIDQTQVSCIASRFFTI